MVVVTERHLTSRVIVMICWFPTVCSMIQMDLAFSCVVIPRMGILAKRFVLKIVF